MKPKVFVASSTESIPVATKLNAQIDQFVEVKAWYLEFKNGKTALDSLLKMTNECEHAIFIINGDDKAIIRDESTYITRDNVIFEFGLFLSKIGIEKVWFLINRDIKVHILTDYSGYQYYTYTKTDNEINFNNFVHQFIDAVTKPPSSSIHLNWNDLFEFSKELWLKLSKSRFAPDLIVCTPDASAFVTAVFHTTFTYEKPEVYTLIEDKNESDRITILKENQSDKYIFLPTERWTYAIPTFLNHYKESKVLVLVIYTGSGETVNQIKDILISKIGLKRTNIKTATLIQTPPPKSNPNPVNFYARQVETKEIYTPLGHISRAKREGNNQ